MSTTAIFNTKDIYFTPFSALVEGLSTKDMGQRSDSDMLLKSWNFKQVVVDGDDNRLPGIYVCGTFPNNKESNGDTAVLQILWHIGVPEY